MMKVLRILFKLMLTIAVLFIVIAFFLPKQQQVERSIQVNAPAAQIMPYLTNLKTFNQWSPWAKIDPQGTQYTFTGPASGVGAKMAWSSENKNVGSGSQEIKQVSPNRVDTYLDFGPQGNADAFWELTPNANGTQITWGFETDLGNNPVARWMGLMMDKFVGESYAEGLNDLKNLVEEKDSTTTNP